MASNASRASSFGDKVCHENGFFRRANFVGRKDDYLDFMRKWYGDKVGDYFASLYAEESDQLEYVIGGADCDGRRNKPIADSCNLINYERHGGNCLADSAVFAHCPGPLRESYNAEWTTWSSWSYCDTCGTNHRRFRARQCRSNGSDHVVNAVLCGAEEASFNVKNCPPCPDIDTSDYRPFGGDDKL